MDKEISGQKFMEELELFQAVMIWATNPDNIKIHIVAHEVTQCYGGPEEGGWWYNSGNPVESIVVNTCFSPYVRGVCKDPNCPVDHYEDDKECESAPSTNSTLHFAEVLEKAFPNFLDVYKTYKVLEEKWLPEKSKCEFHSTSGRGYKHEVSIQLDSEGYPKQKPYYS